MLYSITRSRACQTQEEKTMKTEVKKHEQFGEVRMVVLDNVKWFAGRDVAAALDYARPDLFVTKHVSIDNKQFVQMRALRSPVVARTAIINAAGVGELCDAAFCDFAQDVKAWLLNSVEESAEKPALFGRIGYIDDKGTAWFNAEFVARGLGFTTVANSGNVVVRWNTVHKYLMDFGVATSCNGDYQANCPAFLPENIVYRLAMKANNDAAVEFQMKIANEILPSIRKYGYYSVNGEEPAKKTLKPLVPVAVVYAVLFANMLVKIGYTSDFYRRLKELRKETNQDIVAFVTTPFITLDKARLLELTFKAKFFDRLEKGEFFNVDFEIVKTAILAEDKITKLLDLAEKISSPDEKDKLLIRAANLIENYV